MCEHHNTCSDFLLLKRWRTDYQLLTKYSPFYLLFGQSCSANWLHLSNNTNQNLLILCDYVSCSKDDLQRCHELVWESIDEEQEKQKTYCDLVLVFKPNTKTDQKNKFKTSYSGPQKIREIINNLNFVIVDVKTKKTKWFKRFNSRGSTLANKRSTKVNTEPRIP